MGLRVKTNVASLNAQRNLSGSTHNIGENMAKLSSGYRINKAADDAAGLAISEKLRGNIRSLEQARRNANDGISLVQTAEGSFNEISNILIRMRELATQAASDTIGNTERAYTNREYVQLVDEIERIANSTEYNGSLLLKGPDAISGEDMFTIHIGSGDGTVENTDSLRIDVANLEVNVEELGLGRESEIGPAEVGEDFSRAQAAEKLQLIDNALETMSSHRAYLGAQQSRLSSSVNNLGIQIENLNATNSRIRDVDYAEETASFTQNRILQQAGAAVLSQANSTPEIALTLLR